MSFLKVTKPNSRKNLFTTSFPNCLGKYSFDVKSTITEYSSEAVTAYKVLQINSNNVNSDLCGVVSEMPYTLDISKLDLLTTIPKIEGFLNVVEYGISKIDDREKIGLILEYISPINLLTNQYTSFEGQHYVVIKKIILPLLEVLIQLHNMGITHGCINHGNVFFSNDKAVLSNTVMDPSGYNQNGVFETIDRALTHRSGKNPNDAAADCYAVGVLLLSLISGNVDISKSSDEIASCKARKTSYEFLLHELFEGDVDTLPEHILQIAYWLLHDDPSKRWQATDAVKFIRRMHKKSIMTSVKSQIEQDLTEREECKIDEPLSFIDEKSHHMSAGAVAALRCYDEIKINVRNGKLINALLNNKDISSEFILKVSSLRSDIANLQLIKKSDEMFLTFFILLLNNNMPLKFCDLSVSTLGFFNMLAYVVRKSGIQVSYTMRNLLINGLLYDVYKALYHNNLGHIDKFYLSNLEKMYKDISILKKQYNEDGIRNFAIGYMLPNTVFQHPLLEDAICVSNGDILEMLDSVDNRTFSEVLEDDRIMCFLMGKVKGLYSNTSILPEISLPLKSLETNCAMQLLNILSIVQENEDVQPLRNLASMLYDEIVDIVLSGIRSIEKKSLIAKKLKKAANSGYLNKMMSVLKSPTIDKQQKRYEKVLTKVEKLKKRINSYDAILKDVNRIQNLGNIFTIRVVGGGFLITLLFMTYNLFMLT